MAICWRPGSQKKQPRRMIWCFAHYLGADDSRLRYPFLLRFQRFTGEPQKDQSMSTYDFKNVPPSRSRTMKAIRSRDTKIELLLRRELFRRGLRYRVNYPKLPGKPDIAFCRHKVAIFCDSDFWHGGEAWEKSSCRPSWRTLEHCHWSGCSRGQSFVVWR